MSEEQPRPHSPVSVEVIATEELSFDEQRERLLLERKVERAFVEAGKALRELRDRRLYRNTHGTFEEYCQTRFGFTRIAAAQKIAAAEVVENLLSGDPLPAELRSRPGSERETEMLTNGLHDPTLLTNGLHDSNNGSVAPLEADREPTMLTNGLQILPTSERQVRPLSGLQPEQQREVWKRAVAEVGGKVPSGRVVKEIIDRIRERTRVPISYRVGDVVEIVVKDNPELRGLGGCWAIVSEVREFSVLVRAWNGDYIVREENLKDLGYSRAQREEIGKLSARLSRLAEAEEEIVKAIGATLGKLKRPYLTSLEDKLLKVLEIESVSTFPSL